MDVSVHGHCRGATLGILTQQSITLDTGRELHAHARSDDGERRCWFAVAVRQSLAVAKRRRERFCVRQRLAHLHTERRPNLLGFQKERSFGRGHLHTKRLRCVAWGRGGRSRRWLRWCRDLRCVRRQKCVVLRVERTDGRDGLVVVSASKTGNAVSEFTHAPPTTAF